MSNLIKNTETNITKYNEKISELEDKYPQISSSIRAVVGMTPIGTFITEVAVDNYSRRKQTRINKFIEYFIKYLEKYSSQENTIEKFNSEDFEDIFEGILLRIHRVKSEEKRQRFAKILAESIFLENKNYDFIETFLDLIERLNSKQIEILDHYTNEKMVLDNIYSEINANKQIIKSNENSNHENLKNDNEQLQKKAQNIVQITIKKEFNIDKISLAFHKQDLVSKSLLQDFGLSTFDATPYIYLEITDFGKVFLEYIRNN